MNNDLYTYLQVRWREDNHVKYQKYFEVWFQNLTKTQIDYFIIDMLKTYKKQRLWKIK